MPELVQNVDEYIFLSGRPPIPEFIGFVKSMAVDGQKLDDGALAQEWRKANDRVLELEASEPTWADDPVVADLPAAMQTVAGRVLQDPSVEKTFRLLPSKLAIVELDRLVVYQKFINCRYVDELQRALREPLSPEVLAAFSLGSGLAESQPPVQITMAGQNAYSFTSKSGDLRVLEVVPLDPAQIQGFDTQGHPVGVIAAFVGYGPNVLNVIRIGKRLVLNNGSHRAYTLRARGVTHAPCIVQSVSRDDEIDLLGVPDLKEHRDRFLKDRRPPVLKDFFDERLVKKFPVNRKNRMVQVQIAFQAGAIPG